jgi:hypothetical protein
LAGAVSRRLGEEHRHEDRLRGDREARTDIDPHVAGSRDAQDIERSEGQRQALVARGGGKRKRRAQEAAADEELPATLSAAQLLALALK